MPLSDAEAACLGIDQPVCVGCHSASSTGLLVLRPRNIPPHPPDVTGFDRLAECGVAGR